MSTAAMENSTVFTDSETRIAHYRANFRKLCRLCLSSEKLVSIYSNVQGRNVFYMRNFVKVSLRLLGLKIDKEDTLPNFVCEKCERNLSVICNFKKKCDQSLQILERIRDNTIKPEHLSLQQACSNPGNDKVPQKKVARRKASLKSYSQRKNGCEAVLKKLPQGINVEKIKRSTSCNATVLPVKEESKFIPDVILQEAEAYPLMVVQENGQPEAVDSSLKAEAAVSKLRNEQDEPVDWIPWEMVDSERAAEDRDAERAITAITKEELAYDLDEADPPRVETSDSECEYQSPGKKRSRELLDAKRAAGKQKAVCSICGAMVNNIKSHQVIHSETRPHQCEICPKNFTSRNKLQSHINSVHLRKRDFKCDICGKAFLEKNNLKGHLRIHKGDRKYTCDLCPKTFLFAGTLRCHKLTHTQEKKHECKVCGKLFLMRTTLNKHLHVHSDQRPHKCDVCDKQFRTSTHKIVHMRTHTGEKPLICRICGMAFAHHKARSVHMKSKHAEALVALDMLDERGHLKF